MTVEEFVQKLNEIAVAVRDAKESPIKGWGLRPPSEDWEVEWFDWVTLTPPCGCTSETCNHVSHDPAAPVIAWVPREGVQVVVLGEEDDEGRITTFIMTKKGREVRFLRLMDQGTYWSMIHEVSMEDVPEYLLARIAQ